MSIPPPQGMTEADYDAIEAAVTETVRGRWFLNEFARRNRLTETRLLLDAMARLEATVAAGQTNLPSADPSIRLLVQRIKEIAGHLDRLSHDMREDGIEDRYWTAVDHQARAVGALMRGAAPAKPVPPPIETHVRDARTGRSQDESLAADPFPSKAAPRMPPAVLPPALTRTVPEPPAAAVPATDPRLAALSALDNLTLAQKLSLFT